MLRLLKEPGHLLEKAHSFHQYMLMAMLHHHKQTRRMLGTVKHVGGGLINWHRARAGGRVRYLACVQAERIKIKNMVLGHGDRLERTTGRNDTGVDPEPAEATKQASVFNFDAAVHHHRQAGLFGCGARFIIFYADLQPQGFGADGDRIGGNGRAVGALAKNVDNINRIRNRF